MALNLITIQDLIDAAEDIGDLEAVVNGSATPGTLTTRLGASLKTLSKIQAEIETIGTGWLAQAEAAATAAAASAAEGLYRDVVSKTFANSPIVPTAGEEGTLYRIDTSGGNVVINLSTLATYNEDITFAFVKTTADANTITINRGGTNTINGGTSLVISQQYVINVIVGDLTSGSWISAVQSSGVADGSITTAKLADASVTAAKIASGVLGKRILNRAYAVDAVADSTTTQIPVDDTIPQLTEGEEVVSLSFTVVSASSKLLIKYGAMLAASIGSANATLALFVGSGSNAAHAVPVYIADNGVADQGEGCFEIDSPGVGAVTIALRYGTAEAGTCYVNGIASGRLYGGVSPAYIEVLEVEA